MSRYKESNCVGCSSIFGSCMGESCPNYEIETWECDHCGADVDTLYEYDGNEYCPDCILEVLEEEGVISVYSM